MKYESQMLWGLFLSDEATRKTAIILAIAVAVIVMLYGAAIHFPDVSIALAYSREISLSEDRSLGEIINYGLCFLSLTLFLLAAIENQSKALGFLCAFMLFAWLDDAARYHERLGKVLSSNFELWPLPRLRSQDVGEILAWGIAGILFASYFAVVFSCRKRGELGVLASVGGGLLLLAACGIALDMLHIAAPGRFHRLLGVIEDGGEMVAVTWIAAVALLISRKGPEYFKRVNQRNRDTSD